MVRPDKGIGAQKALRHGTQDRRASFPTGSDVERGLSLRMRKESGQVKESRRLTLRFRGQPIRPQMRKSYVLVRGMRGHVTASNSPATLVTWATSRDAWPSRAALRPPAA